MHRSGTSAVTRVLGHLGAALPKAPLAANSYNPDGYWEPTSVTVLNDEILGASGSRWDDWTPLERDSLGPAEWEAYESLVVSLLEQEFGQADLFVLKDPRITRLTSLYKRALGRLGVRVVYVVSLRNPLAVARSLADRDQTDEDYAQLVWLRHVLDAEQASSTGPRGFVSFESLADNPIESVNKLGEQLGIRWPNVSAATAAEIQQLVRPALIHQHASRDELKAAGQLGEWVREAYDALLSLESNPADEAALARLSEIRHEFDAGSAIFGPATRRESARVEVKSLVARAQKSERENAGLQRLMQERAQELGERKVELAQLRQQLDALVATAAKELAAKGRRAEAVEASRQRARDAEMRLAELRRMVASLGISDYEALARNSKVRWSTWVRAWRGITLGLKPAHQLKRLSSKQGTSHWQMLGHDPNFELTKMPRGKLPAGYYELSIAVPRGAKQLTNAKLYADSGMGYNEREATALLFVPSGELLRAGFTLPKATRRLRFDPSTKRGKLSTGVVRLRRVSKVEHYLKLIKLVAAAEGSYWRAARRGLALLGKRGIRGAAAALRSKALRESIPPRLRRRVHLDVARYVPESILPRSKDIPVKLIAFYLPQFHAIPENDQWWGTGFTEWTNVRPATPQFKGHYQPHVPDRLGYYDLTDVETQRRQVELAEKYGLGGFCFYFYWFGGKTLLETPVQNYLDDESLGLPFCLCWANENWSRRWDGRDQELLIAQHHSAQDDIAFVAHIAKYLRDPRYIRVDGKPLLIVYRPNLLPSAKDSAARWRNWCADNGIGEIYIAYVQSFEAADPASYGFDAAIEFPPNRSSAPDVRSEVVADKEFVGRVLDWSVLPERSRNYEKPSYTLFRGVNPSWDNTARRKRDGTIFVNSTPDLYEEWLRNAAEDTVERFEEPSKRLVFVNAWNEWAEGAHLEPDARLGFAYLEATKRALDKAGRPRRRILLVSHDAHPHGAQLLVLSMATHFASLGFSVDLIVLGGGILMERFASVATLIGPDEVSDGIEQRLRDIAAAGCRVAIVNTTASGSIIPALKQAGFFVVSLVHELPGLIAKHHLEEPARLIATSADTVVFPAESVQSAFEGVVGGPIRQPRIRPQGIYLRNSRLESPDPMLRRAEAKARLGIDRGSQVVLSVGYADDRKGIDLFVSIILELATHNKDVLGVWVGHQDQRLYAEQERRIEASGHADRFRFTGFVSEPQEYYFAADVYALTSREDPFPSTVLEALDASVPVVAFENIGGSETILRRGCGVMVPQFDTHAYSLAVADLLGNPETAREMARTGHQIVAREFEFRHYLYDLLTFAGEPLPRISVVVPNYNYARYLKGRLASIVGQSVPIYELIILDDCSTDNSVEIVQEFLATCDIPVRFVANERNSGSVFRQWARGVELATGDIVWIAEADDLSDPDFLSEALAGLEVPDVVMSYTQSRMMNAEGRLGADYLDYVSEIDPDRWTSSYVANGIDEISAGLFLKNIIPNVSAALFRRDRLQHVLEEHLDEVLGLKNTGDWFVYLRLLEMGKIAFSSRAMNFHRRHSQSVTISSSDRRHFEEISRLQRQTIDRHALGREARDLADAYLARLNRQFGIEGETPSSTRPRAR